MRSHHAVIRGATLWDVREGILPLTAFVYMNIIYDKFGFVNTFCKKSCEFFPKLFYLVRPHEKSLTFLADCAILKPDH